ncbi:MULTISPECIES: aldo/keto reductase [Microbacterium]|jgi:aryl-alcohol dehydrogenase-like predicted oxidoreductase|uniref:aldo/keto reductase n=1 Tax=Microbacterium TaxID=33882 RepID=UPI001E2F4A80|nr:aldo/keto reductase [Microbacterium nymphoidis]MCD2496827.1 aldo/keto reductase [Microbacterium nymphoidis]
MRILENGGTMDASAVGAVPPASVAGSAHPSHLIDVQAPSVGAAVRVPLGESGLRVFPLLLGGAEFGWTIDRDHAFEVLDRYRELGGNALHTADGFASGRSEYIIGQWLAARACRDEMAVTVRIGSHPDNPGLGSVNLVRAVEASLTRLGVDHLDVMYLDGTDSRANLEDVLATSEWLVESGKVRSIGAYAFSAERLVEARILVSAGYPRIHVLDVAYNALRRADYEGDIRLIVGAQGLAVTPSHALEHGFLSGVHRSRSRLQGTRGMQLLNNLNRRGTKLLRVFDAIGAELGVADAAVALAWLRAQRGIVAPIVNAYAPAQVDELVQSAGVSLGRGHLAEIARAVA